MRDERDDEGTDVPRSLTSGSGHLSTSRTAEVAVGATVQVLRPETTVSDPPRQPRSWPPAPRQPPRSSNSPRPVPGTRLPRRALPPRYLPRCLRSETRGILPPPAVRSEPPVRHPRRAQQLALLLQTAGPLISNGDPSQLHLQPRRPLQHHDESTFQWIPHPFANSHPMPVLARVFARAAHNSCNWLILLEGAQGFEPWTR